jgi:cell volume regulation protein A
MFEQFLLLGLILLTGFAADIIFQKTRISQVLILITLGFLLGPVFNIVDASSDSVLFGLMPFVGALALMILLFDGGINLNVFSMVKVLPRASIFTLTVFALSILTTAALAKAFLGYDTLYGLLLGAAVGGTSSAIVLAMLERACASPELKSLLTLESTLTDTFCIVAAFVILQIIQSRVQVEPTGVLNLLAGSFSIAIVLGAVVGIAWLVVLERIYRRGRFPYMLTLAVILLLYASAEAAKGNGGIAVFAFGIVLGNAKRVAEFLKLNEKYAVEGEIAAFQEEVTFFTRTFFFVFLGLILDFEGITMAMAGFAVAAVLVFLAMRFAAAKSVIPSYPDTGFTVSMLPRGLAAAVLAGLPLEQGLDIPGFLETALLVIILTNIVATVGAVAFGKSGSTCDAKLPEYIEECEKEDGGKPAQGGEGAKAARKQAKKAKEAEEEPTRPE